MKKQNVLQLFSFCIASLSYASSLFAAETLPGFTNHGSPIAGMYRFKQAMVTDQHGAVWIGGWTETAPLAKYSEQTGWSIYSTQNSPLPSNSVNALHHRGTRLYIGTSQGLALYDGTWEIIGVQQGLPDKVVNNVTTLGDSIIVGTKRGVSVRHNALWVHFNTANSPLISDTVTAITLGSENDLWIGTRRGISRYRNGDWQSWDEQNSALTGNWISALHWDNNERLWIGTVHHGVYLLIGGEIVPFEQYFGINIGNNTWVANFSENSEGEVYFAVSAHLGGVEEFIAIVKIAGSNLHLFQSQIRAPALVAYSSQHLWITRSHLGHLMSANLDECLMYDAVNRIEVNNLSVDFHAGGGIKWDRYRGKGHFEAPGGSGLHPLFTSSVWIGGLNNGMLHFAGEQYQSTGRDFWPGPVSSDSLAYQQRQKTWNRVWKISQEQIENHIQFYDEPDYEMPEVITNWPAHGDTLLGEPWFIAPYMDRNSNGLYEPHLGDHPVIRGDEALYFIFNDHRFPNRCSGGPVMGVEIRGLAYGFNQPSDSALYNTLFVNYQVLNRSGIDYTQTRLGFFADFDIGYHSDDHFGSDTTLHTFFAYNATEIDGIGRPGEYGPHPPAMGVVFLNKPLTAFMPAEASFFIPPPGMIFPLPPLHYDQYYGYLGAIWEDGQPLVYGGMGHPDFGGGPQEVKHLFPGNLNNPDEWHELNPAVATSPGDRRALGSFEVGEFNNGDHICFDIAFVFARDYQGTHISSVDLMKERVESIRTYFATNFTGDCIDLISTSIPEIQPPVQPQFVVYPNPASSYVRINYSPHTSNALIQLYSIHGVLIDSHQLHRHGAEIYVGHLKPGVYIIQIQDGNKILQKKLMKL